MILDFLLVGLSQNHLILRALLLRFFVESCLFTGGLQWQVLMVTFCLFQHFKITNASAFYCKDCLFAFCLFYLGIKQFRDKVAYNDPYLSLLQVSVHSNSHMVVLYFLNSYTFKLSEAFNPHLWGFSVTLFMSLEMAQSKNGWDCWLYLFVSLLFRIVTPLGCLP